MSEVTDPQSFPGPHEVVRQVQQFIAESTTLLQFYGRAVDAENRWLKADPETHRDIKAEIQELVSENTLTIAGVSEAMKSHGYEFALRNPQQTNQYPLRAVGFAFDPEDISSSWEYKGYIQHTDRVIEVPLRPPHLTHQPYEGDLMVPPSFAAYEFSLECSFDPNLLIPQREGVDSPLGWLEDFRNIKPL